MTVPVAPMDPLLALAFALQNTRGGYAVLLGSGVSRAAGIPTGWEVVKDLIQMIAAAEGGTAIAEAASDPEHWYETRFGEPPSYSKLLQQIARTPTERRELLRRYFEPTAEEREQGLKVPTRAHRALARLVRDGVIRVILTTNFDPLLETAIRDEGLSPVVLSSADAIRGMMPLHLAPVTIIKLHGDYLDTRLKNTLGELAKYEPAVNVLLDRILEDYGLVVCGWSATWDDALRAAIVRSKGRRFTTFWANRGTLTQEAQQVIEQRGAQVIPVESADQFFESLAEKVESLAAFQQPHPLSTEVAVATLKRYLPSAENRIRLSDLMEEEITRVTGTVSTIIDGALHPDPISVVFDAMRKIEAACETVATLMATGVFWGEDQHRELWVRSLARLGNLAAPGRGRPIAAYGQWDNLLRYPGQLAFYAGGLGALARGKSGEEAVADLILLPQLRLGLNGEVFTPATGLNVSDAVDHNLARQAMPGAERRLTPMSDHLFAVVRPFVRRVIPEDAVYLELFDRFEYLVALAFVDSRIRANRSIWAPVGRLAWRRESIYPPNQSEADKIAGEIEREGVNWLFLRRGLFEGSVERIATAQAAVAEILRRRGFG